MMNKGHLATFEPGDIVLLDPWSKPDSWHGTHNEPKLALILQKKYCGSSMLGANYFVFVENVTTWVQNIDILMGAEGV